MGVDCTLMPVTFGKPEEQLSCYSRLMLNRRSELWPLIAEHETIPVVKAVGYFDGGFGESTDNPYGERHKAAKAGDLAKLSEHDAIANDIENRAIWAFVCALPPETVILIYWS